MGFRSARIKSGLTVLQAADRLGVSDAAVYQWETGVYLPTAKRLTEIARLYHCTVDELLAQKQEEAKNAQI